MDRFLVSQCWGPTWCLVTGPTIHGCTPAVQFYYPFKSNGSWGSLRSAMPEWHTMHSMINQQETSIDNTNLWALLRHIIIFHVVITGNYVAINREIEGVSLLLIYECVISHSNYYKPYRVLLFSLSNMCNQASCVWFFTSRLSWIRLIHHVCCRWGTGFTIM